MAKNTRLVVVGIDLAGSPRRPTGLCVLRDLMAETCVVFRDDEIIDRVKEIRPTLIPIDAPRSLPNGRRTIHDRSGENLRECDRALLRQSIRFFPITLGPMRMLTEPGLALKTKPMSTGYRRLLPRR
ncbi:MAG: hypothetical protein OEV01_08770 [Nitrospira sp.]|nr:hypothetical protein [Nitrospira sp.]MDH4303262.1 hypothetical protein [Nitrospira sp.]